MARSVQANINGRQTQGARRRKSRSVLTNVAIGFGLTVAALMGASLVTVATSVQPASEMKLEMSVAPPVDVRATGSVLAQVSAPARRDLDISKFSRLPGSSTAAPKSSRLEGAKFAALEARRPPQASVRQVLDAAMAKAARRAEIEQQFAALASARPDQDAIRDALGSAMQSLVVVAPRGKSVMPDIIQDATTVANVAELKDMQPVEMAALEETATEDTIAVAELPEASAGSSVALPQAGPLPVIRPSTMTASAEQPEKPNALAAIAAVAPQQRPESIERKPAALAFAKPDNPMREAPASRSAPNWPGIGSKVAIYDISNGVVHMPNGSRLEAHSGIGKMRDNPKYTHVKMRGPTPPGTYKLSMREKLFHGVAAIRLTSVDGKHPQGRTGLLAHTYLLRSRPGDSHGCVAFANYDKFLNAFRRGQITHMVIVPKWDGKRPGSGGGNFLAKLFSGSDA